MSDVYFIVITSIFGLFVLFVAYYMWQSMTYVRSALSLKESDLTAEEKATLVRFCQERAAQKNRTKPSPTSKKTKSAK